MFKCNLVIPGFRKSGTSTLHEYLALHPDICMSRPKETDFFSVTANWRKGGEWYDSLFSDKGRQRRWYGESSVGYAIWPPALQRIRRHLHGVRLIVLLRHPVERLLSHYQWHWMLGIESRPLLRAVEEEEKRGYHPDVLHSHRYVTCYLRDSRYSYFCPLIEDMFGARNILYLESDELFRAPRTAMAKCFDFLRLGACAIDREFRENRTLETTVQRTFGLKTLLKPVPRPFLERIDPGSGLRRRVRGILGEKKRRSPKISEKDIGEVTRMLEEDIAFYEAFVERSNIKRALASNI